MTEQTAQSENGLVFAGPPAFCVRCGKPATMQGLATVTTDLHILRFVIATVHGCDDHKVGGYNVHLSAPPPPPATPALRPRSPAPRAKRR